MTPSIGFYGKIPSRGDFVRQAVPTPVIESIDDWCQRVLPGSREILGEAWTSLWMEAPIWRFRLRAGLCGPEPLAGLWLPSTDRAGRLFPLLILATGPRLAETGALLDHAEALAIAAIEADIAPEALAETLADAARTAAPTPLDHPDGTWWTQGGPHVAPAQRSFADLPNSRDFAAMLRD